MLAKLPGWVVDNATSVRNECADYVSMTLEQRGQVLSAACQTAVAQGLSHGQRELVFEWKDKLPRSTLAALQRLRKQRDER